MKLEWHRLALRDRDNHFDYIEGENQRAAAMVDDSIEQAADRLADFPESGRPGRVAGTRELVLSDLPYIIAYVVRDDVVLILRVLHGAQLWPDSIPN